MENKDAEHSNKLIKDTYTEIKDIERFKSTFSIISQRNNTGYLKTINKENYLFMYDGVVLIRILIPELKYSYDIPLNLSEFNKVLSKVTKKDSLFVGISESQINIKSVGVATRNYMFPNTDYKIIDEKTIEQITKISPINTIFVESDVLISEIDNLAFKTNNKYMQKIEFAIKDNKLSVKDCTPFKTGISKIDIPFKEANIKEDSRVRINWCAIKDIVTEASKVSDYFLFCLETDNPLKIISKQSGYEVIIILAPFIESD